MITENELGGQFTEAEITAEMAALHTENYPPSKKSKQSKQNEKNITRLMELLTSISERNIPLEANHTTMLKIGILCEQIKNLLQTRQAEAIESLATREGCRSTQTLLIIDKHETDSDSQEIPAPKKHQSFVNKG